MNLALFIGQIHLDSQRKVIEGAYKRCKELDINLFTFSVYNVDTFIDIGEYNYLSSVDYSEFDGFMIYTETIYDTVFKKAFTERLIQLGKPCVCIDYAVEGIVSVFSDNTFVMKELVEHILMEHGARTINYISGPNESYDSEKRLKAFRDVMNAYNIPIDERRIFTGTYYAESGIQAIGYYKKSNLLEADAYICANDQMALGASIALKELGIEIPKDTLLTGFDNIPQSEFNIPSITSVSRNERELGMLACNMVLDKIDGKEISESSVDASIVYRESCCAKRSLDVAELYNYYSKAILEDLTYNKLLSESSIAFTKATSLRSLCAEINIYLTKLKIDKMQMFLSSFTDCSDVLATFNNGKFTLEAIKTTLVSKRINESSNNGKFYLLCPVHYLEENYGYICLEDNFLPLKTEAFHLFVTNISNALKSLKTVTNIQVLADKVKESSCLDPLTQVYNRLGFFDIADDIYNQAKDTGEPLYIIFSDLDGLKKVNDTLGHKAGDSFIRSFADALKAVFKDELIMRFGGDEFVILGKNRDAFEIEAQIEDLKSEIDKVNAKNTDFYPFTLSSSYGFTIISTACSRSLLELIDEADKSMYEKKKKRKCGE